MSRVITYNADLYDSTVPLSGVAKEWELPNEVRSADSMSVQVSTTQLGSTFQGTFKLEGSNDGGDSYVPVSGYLTNTSGTDEFLWRVSDIEFKDAKVTYKNITGSGLAEVWTVLNQKNS